MLQPSPLFDMQRLITASRDENEAVIRGGVQTVALPDDVILCRVLGKYKMCVDGRDEGLSPHLMMDGFWEMWVTEAVPNFLRKGMVACDVGANLGYYTMLCADLVGPAGRVHACEPNRRMASLLARSAAMNGFTDRLHVHPEPMSDTSGQSVRLEVSDRLPLNGFTTPAPDDPSALHTRTLDDIIGDAPLDFVKIDADGAEQAVWRGMRKLVARGAPMTIFLEFTPDRYPDAPGFLDEILAASFTLGIVDPRAGITPVSAQAVLNHAPPNVDRMLILAR